MSSTRDLIDAIRNLVAKDALVSVACTVSNVNTTDYTCDCSPVDGSADFKGVLLNADAKNGFVLVPKNDSVVVITMTSNVNAFVSMVSEVDTILMKGDAFGGLIKIDDLKTQYDANVTAIKAACVAAFTALSGLDGSASLNAFNAAAVAIQNLNKTTLENTKIKHGSS